MGATIKDVSRLPISSIMELNMRKVLLLTNLPVRDGPTDSIIASHLRNMGVEVREGIFYPNKIDIRAVNFLPSPREHVLFYKPDMVIGPEARCQFTIDFYRNCKSWGIQTVIRRTEGGCPRSAWNVMGDDEKKTVIGAWEYDVDLEIVWAEDFANLLAENGYIPRERIFAAGAVTFDQNFIPPLRQKIEGRKNLVFCTNWGHADRNPIYNVPEAPVGSSVHADAYNRHRKGREDWIELIKLARAKLGTMWQFYLSLKVGEWPNEYQQKLGGIINILGPTVTKALMLNSDLIIQVGSTLALHAHYNNLPALSYRGLANQTVGYKYPHVCPNYDDPEELIAAIPKVELNKSNANPDSIAELSKELYGIIDGQACKRVAEKILSLPERSTAIPDVWPPEIKEYPHEGVSKFVVTWICESCKRPQYVLDPARDMISCIHCGVGLARRQPSLPPECRV